MKKRIILLTIALAYTGTPTHASTFIYKKNFSYSSHVSTGSIKFGIDVGGSMARFNSITIDSNTTRAPRFGFHAQVFGAYQLNENLDIALAMGYHNKGHKLKRTTPMLDNSHSLRRLHFNYLQINTQLNIFPGQERQLFLVAGGYVGYLLSAKEHKSTYINDQQQAEPETIDLKNESSVNQLNKWDFGIVLGWGYEFEIGIILKAVGELGIRKIYAVDKDPGRNLSAHVSLGYNFAKLLE